MQLRNRFSELRSWLNEDKGSVQESADGSSGMIPSWRIKSAYGLTQRAFAAVKGSRTLTWLFLPQWKSWGFRDESGNSMSPEISVTWAKQHMPRNCPKDRPRGHKHVRLFILVTYYMDRAVSLQMPPAIISLLVSFEVSWLDWWELQGKTITEGDSYILATSQYNK